MKILAIRGKNLASLEGEFVIDFRKEPLCSSGIFAITGPTGSGKSTLLDAMCISLYNNSPRINKVTDSADIYDIKESTIKEKDCRNILRRGTADGFAETDFAAIDDKEYRAHWSVRRSRNKTDGKLQDYSYSLYCITDNREISGTKTELLELVQQLIGLNYNQFTRAVLLAQGDFATFLKASSREKAEILEKLTGTEIYSNISQAIYDKHKNAEIELKSIEEKIKETALLNTEEIVLLEQEKNNILNERKLTENDFILVQEKIKWIERLAILNSELDSAKKVYALEQEKMNSMQETINLLKKIDAIQPIRDTYIQILSIKKDIKTNREKLQEYNIKKDVTRKSIAETESELKKQIEQQNILNKEWSEVQPKIREALKIETEQKNTQIKLHEIEHKIKQTKDLYNKSEETYKTIISSIDTQEKKQADNSIWFNKHKAYEEIVAKTEILRSYIEETENTDKQITEKEQLYATTIQLQKKHEQLLEEEEKEFIKLNETLTTEIATLRNKLIEGEPCPVCGSRHHEIEQITVNVLNEEILLKAKKSNAERIEYLKKCINSEKTESIQLSSSIENYKNIYETKMGLIIDILNGLPEYSTLAKDNTNINELKKIVTTVKNIASEFQERKELAGKLSEQLSVEHNKKKNCEEKLKEQKSTLSELEESKKIQSEALHNYNARIKELIGAGYTAEERENDFIKKIENANTKVVEYSEKRNSQILVLEKNQQLIETTNDSINKCEKEFIECKESIVKFLSSQNNITTLEELHTIATIIPEKVISMRTRVQDLEKSLLTSATKLKERTRNIEEHKKAEIQPNSEETDAILQNTANGLKEKTEKLLERITQIEVVLKNNENNKVLSQKLHKEYSKKEETAIGWKKLNELLGSADGKKFRVIAQGYTLDILLSYSNKHLKELSSRYELARTSADSLAIKVIDLDMLSESRSVHSLSGGESFLVSLALALALSSLSSNRMSIESLFIDEGFGSLDSETLRIAMDALDRLQSQGRKIGVISHLADMIERIPAKICIQKGIAGKSKIVIK